MFDFSTVVDRHGTWCTQWDYVADRFGAADLLPFTISDMDFATAPCITDALHQRINHGVFGYVAGKMTNFWPPWRTGSGNALTVRLIPKPWCMGRRSFIWSRS